jgi:ammonium transporter Rh
MEKKNPNRIYESILIISQVLVVGLYGLFTTYDQGVHPATRSIEIKAMSSEERVQTYYPLFMDVHLMVFVGYGFLVAFLKTYSWTAVAYNMVAGVYALQLTILF